MPDTKEPHTPQDGLFSVLVPYKWLIAALVATTLISNAFNLWIPKIIAAGIDTYTQGHFNQSGFIIEFFLVSFGVFAFTFFQNVVQTYAAERVARDMRNKV